jgi:hypothetical protein
VVIDENDSQEFAVIGTVGDPARFPQRMRVAAWALFEAGIYGRYVIEYDRESGVVTITREA